MNFVFLILFTLFYIGCNSSSSQEIYGTWQNTGTSQDTITFNRDGTISNAKGKFEVVTSVSPKQIYMIIDREGEPFRAPFAIYDIRGDKLVLGLAVQYERTIGGIPFGGISRSEFPKDFSGEVLEYQRKN